MKKITLFSIILLAISIFYSCNESYNIGQNILPGNDFTNINLIDTVEIFLTTEEAQPIISSGVNHLIVGKYNDPVFGTSEASFMTQIRQIEYPGWNADSLSFDSVCLFLPLALNDKYYYGSNKNEPMELVVYKVTDTLNKTFYSDQDPSEYSDFEEVGNNNTYIHEEEIIIGYDTNNNPIYDYLYYLVVRLNDDFGDDLVTNSDNYFYNSAYFHEVLKGLYIKTNSDNSGLYKIITNNDATDTTKHSMPGLTIFYNDTLQYNLPITSSCGRFNMFSHDYSNAQFYDQLQDSTISSNYAYLQSMGGTRVKFRAPGLVNLDNMVINKANLIFETDNSLTGSFAPLDEIWFAALDTSQNIVRFQEFYSSTYNGATFFNNKYNFDITRIVQNYIDGLYQDSYFEFYLMDLSGGSSFKRSVITSGTHSSPAKIEITYTKIQ